MCSKAAKRRGKNLAQHMVEVCCKQGLTVVIAKSMSQAAFGVYLSPSLSPRTRTSTRLLAHALTHTYACAHTHTIPEAQQEAHQRRMVAISRLNPKESEEMAARHEDLLHRRPPLAQAGVAQLDEATRSVGVGRRGGAGEGLGNRSGPSVGLLYAGNIGRDSEVKQTVEQSNEMREDEQEVRRLGQETQEGRHEKHAQQQQATHIFRGRSGSQIW